ncbi:phenylacetic acid degradation protein [Staphylospora marina]|uniref:phenylacetic acid degradation protein n=1 Tax=Staphylospora marina TaxID=2490858 RepID=UPI000F5C227C|nr:phenylacetic acid degradation protein [Staphylospora marina]
MAAEKPVFEAYEVFVQKSHMDHHVHVGSLIAPSPEVALQTARENYLRRDKAVNIWVVPQSQIFAAPYDDDFLSRELDRRYREVAGYTENGRLWRMFKEKEITIEEIVRYVHDRDKAKKQAASEVRRGGESK